MLFQIISRPSADFLPIGRPSTFVGSTRKLTDGKEVDSQNRVIPETTTKDGVTKSYLCSYYAGSEQKNSETTIEIFNNANSNRTQVEVTTFYDPEGKKTERFTTTTNDISVKYNPSTEVTKEVTVFKDDKPTKNTLQTFESGRTVFNRLTIYTMENGEVVENTIETALQRIEVPNEGTQKGKLSRVYVESKFTNGKLTAQETFRVDPNTYKKEIITSPSRDNN